MAEPARRIVIKSVGGKIWTQLYAAFRVVPAMNRQKAILSATILLLLFAVTYWIWSNWGLITVDVNGKPLADVIRSIEKQGGIVLKTNLDPAKPVNMHVFKVPLTEAMEKLAAITESRWRLGYLFGPDSATLKLALEAYGTNGKRPEGWKNFDVPLFRRSGSDDEVVPMDPREDTWNVKEPEDKTLQGFMQSAATGVSASFTCPEAFNPAVSKTPSSGQIRKSAPQLAKIAGAKVQEVFFLMGRPPRTADSDQNPDRDRERDDDGLPGGPRFGRGGPGGSRGASFTLMRERQLAEIAKLPPSMQKSAKAEFEEREKFFASLRDLSDDERRAKFAEYMNNPANQDSMQNQQMKGNERNSPEQRLAKYQTYVAHKQAVLSARQGQ
jgi:hypothetical protein